MKNILKTASFLACSLAVLASPMLEASESFTAMLRVPWRFGGDGSPKASFGRISCAPTPTAPVGRIHAKDCLEDGKLRLDNKNIYSIKEIDFRGIGGATKVSLRQNYLTSVEGLPDMQTMRELDLSKNQLEDPRKIQIQPGIEKLNLSGNFLKSLVGLPFGLNLKDVDFSHNQLQDLYGIDDLSLIITMLNVSGNQLPDLQGMECDDIVVDLDAHHNKINTLEHLAGCQRLSRLDVSRNKLTSLDTAPLLPNLGWLDLSSNPLSDIRSIGRFPKLDTLFLDDTNIRDLSPLQRELGPDSKLKDVYVCCVTERDLPKAHIIRVSHDLPNVSFHTTGGTVKAGVFTPDRMSVHPGQIGFCTAQERTATSIRLG